MWISHRLPWVPGTLALTPCRALAHPCVAMLQGRRRGRRCSRASASGVPRKRRGKVGGHGSTAQEFDSYGLRGFKLRLDVAERFPPQVLAAFAELVLLRHRVVGSLGVRCRRPRRPGPRRCRALKSESLRRDVGFVSALGPACSTGHVHDSYGGLSDHAGTKRDPTWGPPKIESRDLYVSSTQMQRSNRERAWI